MKYELCFFTDEGNRILVKSFDRQDQAVEEMIRLTHREFRIPRWPDEEMKDLYLSWNDYGLEFYYCVEGFNTTTQRYELIYCGDSLYHAFLNAKMDYHAHRMERLDYTISAFNDAAHFKSWYGLLDSDNPPIAIYDVAGRKLEEYDE